MTNSYISNFKNELLNANGLVSQDTKNYINFINANPSNKTKLKTFISKNGHAIYANITEIINIYFLESNVNFNPNRKENCLEMFTEFIDSIYYAGYAQEMSESNPDKFTWEYNEFVGNMN